MRICDLTSGMSGLQRETKTLQEQWVATKIHWQDDASREFEKVYLEPLLPNLRLALGALHEFSDSVQKAEAECRDDATA